VIAVRLRIGAVTMPPGLAQWKGKRRRGAGRPRNVSGPGRRYGPGLGDEDDEEVPVDG